MKLLKYGHFIVPKAPLKYGQFKPSQWCPEEKCLWDMYIRHLCDIVINCFSKNCVVLETDPTGEEKMDTATDEVNSGEGGGGDKEETKDKYD